MKIIYFNLSAIVVLVTMIASICSQRKMNTRIDYAFLIAVLAVFVATLAGSFAVYYDNLGPGNVSQKFIFHGIYLAFHSLTSGFYIFYLILLTDTMHRVRAHPMLVGASLIPAAVMIVTLIVNIFTPVLYYINDQGVYSHGPVFSFVYIVGMFYLLLGLCYIIRWRKLFTLGWILTLFASYPLIVAAMVVEYFFPVSNIEMLANTIGMLFVYTNIHRPGVRIDPVSGLGSREAYQSDTRRAFLNKKEVREVMLRIVNYPTLRAAYGTESANRLKRQVADAFRRVDRDLDLRASLYYMQSGRFRMKISERRADRADEAVELIRAALDSIVNTSAPETHLQLSLYVVDFPRDISDWETMRLFDEALDTMPGSGQVTRVSDLLARADFAMLLNIDRIIERAIQSHSLHVWYQPIYSVAEQRFVACEALMRMSDPEYGTVPPSLFIPAAEKSGTIGVIDQMGLAEVCEFVASDEYRKLGLRFVDVNFSAVEGVQRGFAEWIVRTMDEYGVPHGALNFEVTETAVAASQDVLFQNLQLLADAGIGLSLDDFGTGYSNYQRLAQMPFHVVKLDKSLVDMRAVGNMPIVLQSVVDMFDALGLQVVVEGVETADDARTFIDMGCDYIQGYYYAKPMPREELAAALS